MQLRRSISKFVGKRTLVETSSSNKLYIGDLSHKLIDT